MHERPGGQAEQLLFHLNEAIEELSRLALEVQDASAHDDLAFGVGLQHAYHHLNFAWNTRNIPSQRISEMSDDDFAEWGRFPTDLPTDALSGEA